MAIRWGVVSAGKISNDFVNSVNSYPGSNGVHDIAAVAARDPKRAEEFAKIHKIKNVFETYEAMAKSKEIDVAYIGALNPDHYQLSKLFLENGKHVLCEKPLCLNGKQAHSLINFAREKKLFLMEAVWSRFFPAYSALEKEIQLGKLGDILFVEANFGIHNSIVDRVNKKEMGGSTLMDIGIYLLQFAQFVFKKEPIKVTSSGELNENGVDSSVSIILDYEGGKRAVLNAHSKVKLWNKATVTGVNGRIMVSEPFHCPIEIELRDGKKDFPLHSSDLPYNFINSAGLVYEANEVKRCIDKGLIESPHMSHNDSLVLAKLEDTLRNQIGVHYDADNIDYP